MSSNPSTVYYIVSLHIIFCKNCIGRCLFGKARIFVTVNLLEQVLGLKMGYLFDVIPSV